MRTLIAILAIVIVLAGCSNPSGSQGGQQVNKTIVCFGDSLTEGYGASKPGEVDKSKSYPAYLQKKTSRPVVNAGISGDTSSGALARVDKDVLSKKPGMVIILLGANDFFHLRPASETKGDLQKILNKLKSENRKIYLVSFIGDANWEAGIFGTPFALVSGFSTSSLAALLSDYRKMLAELTAENRDIGYIPDIWTGVWGIHMSDPIHPNAEGYEIIADTVFNAIKKNLTTEYAE